MSWGRKLEAWEVKDICICEGIMKGEEE